MVAYSVKYRLKVMDIQMNEFDKLWLEKEAEDRSGNFARFKRALWHGGRTENVSGFRNTVKNIPNIVISTLGHGKGLRKTIRNAPKNLVSKGIGAAAGAVAASLPIGAFVPESIAEHAMDNANNALLSASINLSEKIGFTLVEGVGSVLVTDTINATNGKKYQKTNGIKYKLHSKIKGNKVIHDTIFRNTLFKTRPEERISEDLRKQIKSTVKKLRKENGFLLIDRNLVKMKDAKNKIAPAVQQLITIAPNVVPDPESKKSFFNFGSHFSDLNEKNVEVADHTLRAVAETTYYAKKISGVVDEIQGALGNLTVTLDNLSNEIMQLKETLREPITAVLTESEGHSGKLKDSFSSI